jgi:electron transfer flavoprotein beta subunit
MGADNALFIKCAIPCDATSVAKMLAETLKQRAFDIYFLGMKAVDDDSGVVGPMLAEFLGIPCVTMVTKMEIKDGKVTARRETEMGFEIVETSLPAVFTAQKGLNEPRYASLKGIMLAKKKSIEEITTTQVDNVIEVIEMKYPPARQEGRILGKGVEVVPELVRLLRDEAKIL